LAVIVIARGQTLHFTGVDGCGAAQAWHTAGVSQGSGRLANTVTQRLGFPGLQRTQSSLQTHKHQLGR